MPVPTQLTASAVNSTSIRVTWKAPSHSSLFGGQYLITVRNATHETHTVLKKAAYTMTNLNPSSIYNVTVQAANMNGMAFSAATSISVQLVVKDTPVPTQLTASAVNSTSIRFTWKAPRHSSQFGGQYLITVRNATHETHTVLKKAAYTMTNLNPSSIYNVTVQASDMNGMAVSAATSISVQLVVKELPITGHFTAVAINSTCIRVMWQKPHPMNNYRNQYHLTIYGYSYTKRYTVQETEIIVNGLDTYTIYNLTIQAVWANGTIVPDVAATSVQN
ncbi:unnamed protein product, partial [Schistocephalus solidus]|uniref:Receptor-type tyrosine-protein phosphatase eta-like n=1 Tax=Schistocephalus solidus TaxID=70667 RepID=A0A183TSA8_SCHSO